MDAVANIVQQGQPTASGTTSIAVEKHKNNFKIKKLKRRNGTL